MNYPPVYVIHCTELPDRTAAAKAHFAERGIPARWWQSAHGRTWGLRTVLEYEPGKRISSGHVSLNLSHWYLWNHLLHTLPDDGFAMVCEDDCEFPENFADEYTAVLSGLTRSVADWGFVFLGVAETEPAVWHKISERIGGGASRFCRIHDVFGTHAYLVRKSALPVLIDRMRAAQRNLDQQLYQRVLRDDRVRWCAVLPTLVTQRTFDYKNAGRPEWSPSCVDVAEEPAPPDDPVVPVPRPAAESEGRPSPARVELTTAVIDPFPCIYRGEPADAVAVAANGKTVPLFECARLGATCHDRPKLIVTDPGVASCETCAVRLEMAADAPRDRLPVPDGHFNPSLAVWNGKLVLATRDSWGHSKVALWELTNSKPDWTGAWAARPVGSHESNHPHAPRLEDPRLFVAPGADGRDALHAAFNLPDGYPPRRVKVGYGRFKGDLSGFEHFEVFDSPYGNVYEKNWVPFADRHGWHWVYATKPAHNVIGEHQNWETPNRLPWSGGALRGGAAPVLVSPGDPAAPPDLKRPVYYHFAHGCLKRLAGNVYTVGCVQFDAYPPYQVLKQTPTPLAWPDLPRPGEDVVKRYVLFPGGAVPHAGAWHIACGIDDSYCRIIRLSYESVNAALADVPETEQQRLVGIRDTPACTGQKEGAR